MLSSRSIPALFVLLAACGGKPQVEAPTANSAELARDACVEQHCPEGSDEGCAAASCTLQEADWKVRVDRIGWDGDTRTVSVSARLEHTPARIGEEEIKRTRPVHVGVTVVTTDGEEVDLLVQTLFPAALDAPVIFSTTLEADARDVLIGVWDRKIEPCDVDRYGCKAFGFVLDDSLASWPPKLYSEGQRQRILPNPLTIRVAGPASSDDLKAAVKSSAELFGSEVKLEPQGPLRGTLEAPELRYADDHDAYLAGVVASYLAPGLGVETLTVKQVADLPVVFELAVPTF